MSKDNDDDRDLDVIADKVAAKIKSKDYDGKLDSIAKRIDDLGKSGEHDHEKSSQDQPHFHATHSYDKYCPGCGGANPDYKEDQATCTDCGQSVGTVEEIEKGVVNTCPHCGGKEAEHKSRGTKLF